MYVKLFAKILDSSIWLEPNPTRIVWITLLAAMDQDGFAQFASPGNVAARALVSREEAEAALKTLESPDPNSSDPENEGSRIERVPGGWVIRNAHKYRELGSRERQREGNRERALRFRERNARVTPHNASVTGESRHTEAEAEVKEKPSARREKKPPDSRHEEFKTSLGKYWKSKNAVDMPWGPSDARQLSNLLAENPKLDNETFLACLRNRAKSEVVHSSRPASWLSHALDYLNGPLDKYGKPKGIVEMPPEPPRITPAGERMAKLIAESKVTQ